MEHVLFLGYRFTKDRKLGRTHSRERTLTEKLRKDEKREAPGRIVDQYWIFFLGALLYFTFEKNELSDVIAI